MGKSDTEKFDMEDAAYRKTGYLNSSFRLFHILDQSRKTFEFHYHDFHKILIFLRGNVSYQIEGKEYQLKPQDIILVHAGEIHRPVIHDESVYERIIIYVSPAFFEAYHQKGYDLNRCFLESRRKQSGLIRIPEGQARELTELFRALTLSFSGREDFAADLFQEIKFIELLIVLNRLILKDTICYMDAMTANPAVQDILKYINDHLSEEDLSIDTIAQAAFLNRSYLMHLFKEETGYTVGKYITEKRLFQARSLLAAGLPVTEACYRSGFKNYTAFYYAHKNKYGSAPSKLSEN